MRRDSANVVIIGAGASGLAAAIEIGMLRPDLDVVVLEKNDEPGRKIRATGSGRCNISNTGAEGYPEIMEFFSRIGLVTRAYDNGLVYPYSESAADVAKLLATRAAETGVRIIAGAECTAVRQAEAKSRFAVSYKLSNTSAGKVEERHAVSTFARKMQDRNTGAGKVRVKSADVSAGKSQGGRAAAGGDYIIYADYVVLAVGGKAGPTYGTTGDGYRIARELGHSIVTPVPVLTGIECVEWNINGDINAVILAGTRTRGHVRLYKAVSDIGNNKSAYAETMGVTKQDCSDPVMYSVNQTTNNDKWQEFANGERIRMELLCEEKGEIQFTKYGLSGICVFNLTRHMRYDRAQGEGIGDFIVTADLFPDGNIKEFLEDRREHAHPEELTGDVLRTVLKENIARYVLEKADNVRLLGTGYKISLPQIAVRDLSDADIDAIAGAVHELTFHPSGIRGWKEAQATSGGVSTSEISEETCESLLVNGLYITGELADRDYPCGGFNLSNAWLTGLKAARAIADADAL